MEIKLKINKFINKIKECPIFKINLKKIFSVLFLLVFVWIIAMCLIDANYKFNPILLMCGIAF